MKKLICVLAVLVMCVSLASCTFDATESIVLPKPGETYTDVSGNQYMLTSISASALPFSGTVTVELKLKPIMTPSLDENGKTVPIIEYRMKDGDGYPVASDIPDFSKIAPDEESYASFAVKTEDGKKYVLTLSGEITCLDGSSSAEVAEIG